MFTSRFEQSFSQSLISQPDGYGHTEMIIHSDSSNNLIRSPCRPSLSSITQRSTCFIQQKHVSPTEVCAALKCFENLEKEWPFGSETCVLVVIIKTIFPDKTGILLGCQEQQHRRTRLLFSFLTMAGGSPGKPSPEEGRRLHGLKTLNAQEVRSACCRH